VWVVVGLMALGLVAATAVALIRDSGEQTDVVLDDPAGSSTTSTPTTVASTTTVAPTSTSTPAVTTTPPAPTPPPAAGPVPGAVTVIRGGPGGSGEIVVQWDAIAGATGYRVLRSDAAGGPYAVVADFDVTTGRATAADDGVTVWSSQHSYLPDRGPLGQPDSSPWFQYVEVGEPRVRWFQVVAYNAAGDAPPSAAVSGSPP
jgi:hypothetical protein